MKAQIKLFILGLFVLATTIQLKAQDTFQIENTQGDTLFEVRDEGILVRKVTTATRIANGSQLAANSSGLLVYDTDTKSFWAWNGAAWTELDGTDLVADADADPTNEIELPTGGTSGQLLSTDGSGNYSWINANNGGTIQGTDGNTFNIRAANEGNVTGNARGERSVDLQTDRSSASQVASGLHAVIGGGSNNRASNTHALVGGGIDNLASGLYATVAGGDRNLASNTHTTVGGGIANEATKSRATVGGGAGNIASGESSTVSGGEENEATGNNSFIGGGVENQATGSNSFIGGGEDNVASGDYSSISGGNLNKASKINAHVGGGATNTASGQYSTVAGGAQNIASGDYSYAGGGDDNTASGRYSSISGGVENQATGNSSFIGGGGQNTATGNSSFIGGGGQNTASGAFSNIGGGFNLNAPSYGEAAIGVYNETYTPNSATSFNPNDRLFVVGNGTTTTDRSNALTILKNGNVGIGQTIPTETLEVDGTVKATTFVGDGSGLTGISATDNLGNHRATQNIRLNGNYLSGDGGDEGIYIQNNGDVGIGTNTPGSDLEIESTSFGTMLHLNNSFAPEGEFIADVVGNAGPLLDISSAFTGDISGTFVGLQVDLNASGTQNYAALFQGGHVGIGTATPSSTLEVNGETKTTTLQISGGSPNAGDVLTATDTDGNATWTAKTPQIAYTKRTNSQSFPNTDTWRDITNTITINNSTAGGVVHITAQASARLTTGSSIDPFEYRVILSLSNTGGCSTANSTLNTMVHVPESGTGHNEFKTIPYEEHWPVDCPGTARFRLQMRNTGDDAWQVQDAVLTVVKY